jgi:hypothetical protein
VPVGVAVGRAFTTQREIDDGSITSYFGLEQPEGAKNWLETTPGRGWFSIIRWYGPT